MEVVLDWFLDNGIEKDKRRENEIPDDVRLESIKPQEAVQLLDKRIDTLQKQETYKYWLFVLARSGDTEVPLTEEHVVKVCNNHKMYDPEDPFVADLVQEFSKASMFTAVAKHSNPQTDLHHFKLLMEYLNLPQSDVRFERPADRALPCWTPDPSGTWKTPKITHVLRWTAWVNNAVKIGRKEALEEVEKFQDRPTFFVKKVGNRVLNVVVRLRKYMIIMLLFRLRSSHAPR